MVSGLERHDWLAAEYDRTWWRWIKRPSKRPDETSDLDRVPVIAAGEIDDEHQQQRDWRAKSRDHAWCQGLDSWKVRGDADVLNE